MHNSTVQMVSLDRGTWSPLTKTPPLGRAAFPGPRPFFSLSHSQRGEAPALLTHPQGCPLDAAQMLLSEGQCPPPGPQALDMKSTTFFHLIKKYFS